MTTRSNITPAATSKFQQDRKVPLGCSIMQVLDLDALLAPGIFHSIKPHTHVNASPEATTCCGVHDAGQDIYRRVEHIQHPTTRQHAPLLSKRYNTMRHDNRGLRTQGSPEHDIPNPKPYLNPKYINYKETQNTEP